MSEFTTELVSLAGDTPERVRGRKRVAQSSVTISLGSDAAVEKCLAELAASDKRLADTEASYDWQIAIVSRPAGAEGGQVRFDVAWYDRDFYAAKRDVYLNADHLRMFAGMDADVSDIEVTHFELAA